VPTDSFPPADDPSDVPEEDEPGLADNEVLVSSGRVLDRNKPALALTFDDGPNLTNSVRILDELEARGLVASYFVIGVNIRTEEEEEVMRRGYAMGCEYNPHMWYWATSALQSEEDLRNQILQTCDKIVAVLGEDAYPKFWRPHTNGDDAGADTTVMFQAAKELGFPMANGIWGNDWDQSIGAQGVYDLIVPRVRDGAIIGLHDGKGNDMTAEAIGSILDALLEEGYQFVTLSEMFELKGVEGEPGQYISIVGSGQ
jgi:peptidoglycan/xylan/chitin deacetylase (PgdA/CDA1 family)